MAIFIVLLSPMARTCRPMRRDVAQAISARSSTATRSTRRPWASRLWWSPIDWARDQRAEVVGLAGDGQLGLGAPAHQLDGHDRVGAALVQLAGRVQEAGAVAGGDRDPAQVVADPAAQRLERVVLAEGEVGLERDVVAGPERARAASRSAVAGLGRPRAPGSGSASRTLLVLALDSATLGSSKGSIASTWPAIAMASSKR